MHGYPFFLHGDIREEKVASETTLVVYVQACPARLKLRIVNCPFRYSLGHVNL